MAKLVKQEKNRRAFLKYIAASPILAAGAKHAMAASAADPQIWFPRDPSFIAERPEDAFDIFDLEAVAFKNVPPSHFGFITSGTTDDVAIQTNRRDIEKVALRPRRLRDVRKVDMSRELFGHKYDAPFFLCPVGYERSAHPDGVIAALKASGRHNVPQMISTLASASVADSAKVRDGHAPFFQLYHLGNWEVTKFVIQRAEREGAKMMAVTVDGAGARFHNQLERAKRTDKRFCAECHEVADPKRMKEVRVSRTATPMLDGIPPEIANMKPSMEPLTWELIKRMRDLTKMEIFIKGVMSPEDAALCVKYGYGVHVSNHGGRNEATGASTISVLPDIVAVVKGRVPVLIDSGFRRGMDIAKALAMGATMVGFGRPWMWGLGAFGEAGVDRVIQLTKAELGAAMQQLGAANLSELNSSLVYKGL